MWRQAATERGWRQAELEGGDELVTDGQASDELELDRYCAAQAADLVATF
jgi:hypothetical protein